MRRSQRKAIAWLLLVAVSLNPLVGALAMAAGTGPVAVGCQLDMAASAASDDAGDARLMTDCQQHHACTTACQLAPLPTSALPQPNIDRRPGLAPGGEPASLVTRYLEDIERPPRV